MPSRAFRFAWIALAAVLAACSSSQGLQLPQSPLLAALERKSGLIAYVGIDNNIYTIDQAGGNQQAVTEDAEQGRLIYDLPTWSPSGEMLAYYSISTPGDRLPEGAVHTARVSGETTELFRSEVHFPFYLYWSPDGQYLSFLSTSRNAQLPFALQIAPAEGGEVEVLDTGRPYYWSWSPVQKRLLVHAGGSEQLNPGPAKLAFLDMADPVLETGLGRSPASFPAPAYSPDGSQLLFAAEDDAGRPALFLADAAGMVQSTLTELAGSVAFGWSPTGEHAAYITGPAANAQEVGGLSLVELDDPNNPVITEVEPEAVEGFFWSPDGRQLAYFVHLQAVVPTPQAGTPQPESNVVDYLGLRILQARNNQTKQVFAFLPSEQFGRMMDDFDQYQHSATIWSPDSNYLVVAALYGDFQYGLFIVPASGDFEPRLLTEGTMGFWSWQ